jgi:hypothetical protein
VKWSDAREVGSRGGNPGRERGERAREKKKLQKIPSVLVAEGTGRGIFF